jgi:putative ABC transport system permease protein
VGRVVAIDEAPHRIVGVMPPGFDFPPPVALEGTAPAEKAELWLPLANDLAGGQRGALTPFAEQVLGRIGRQLVTEGVVLALFGGAAGLFLAWSSLALLVGLAPANVPRLDQVADDPGVVACAFAVSLATGLLFSAARATAGPAGSRIGSGLVVAEVALALVLLVGAGLFARSFARLHGIDPGFRAASVLTARVALPRVRYGDDRPAQARAFRRFEAKLAALPGVTATGFVLELPLDADRQGTSASLEGRDAPAFAEGGRVNFRAGARRITAAFGRNCIHPRGVALPAAWSPLCLSRAPCEDGALTPSVQVVILAPALTFATPGYFAAMGVPVVAGRGPAPEDGAEGEPVVVVNESFVRRFLPAAQNPGAALGERVVLGFNPEPRRIVGVVGDVRHDALGLAAVGVYGVLAFAVRRRSREIGVRVALGASRADVVRLVLLRWMGLVSLGIAVGLGASLGLSRLVAGFLFRVGPTDPGTLAIVAAFLATVAAAACYLPTRRALAVDPRTALGSE